MSVHNTVIARVKCPICQHEEDSSLEVIVGYGDLSVYRMGDVVRWRERRAPQNGGRPPDGNLIVEGYAECVQCGTDLLFDVVVQNDRVFAVRSRAGTAAQSSVAPDGSSSLAPPGAPSSAPRVNAGIGSTPESDDSDDKDGQ